MKTKKIKICPLCEGRGYVIERHLTSYHNGYYDETKASCFNCEGSGRLLITKTVKVEPYKAQTEA